MKTYSNEVFTPDEFSKIYPGTYGCLSPAQNKGVLAPVGIV